MVSFFLSFSRYFFPPTSDGTYVDIARYYQKEDNMEWSKTKYEIWGKYIDWMLFRGEKQNKGKYLKDGCYQISIDV